MSSIPSRLLYKYLSPAAAQAVLSTGRLRWSSPLTFNDPFDITQHLRLSFTAEDLQRALIDQVSTLLESPVLPPHIGLPLRLLHATLAHHPDREFVADYLATIRTEDARPTESAIRALAQLQEAWDAALPGFRILCLSEAPDVTSMWNHYAGGYSGIVLGLEARPDVDSPLLLARPITYQDAVPRVADPSVWASALLAGNDGKELNTLFREVQYIKTTAWAYEREWRVVGYRREHDTGLHSDWTFHPLELHTAILGPQIAADVATTVSTLLRDGFPHARLMKAVVPRSGTGFRFETL